jgi:hypothetical protein
MPNALHGVPSGGMMLAQAFGVDVITIHPEPSDAYLEGHRT